MARVFVITTAVLCGIIGVLIGLLLSTPRVADAGSGTERSEAAPVAGESEPVIEAPVLVAAPAAINFADIAARLNPAVVNIDATARSRRARRLVAEGGRRNTVDPFDLGRRGDPTRRGTGTGFLIDAEGHVLTNHHVIEGAERLTVKLRDGRTLRADVVGSDPDTDIALLRLDAPGPFPHAVLGDSSKLRVGEWVCAIGNPLAYEHTVTVGVVSFIGRKLFDPTLDNYIQTDAAISFGNSGGPLINTRGQVIGINAAISRQASNIGFAVPINQARAILPQLKTLGRVERGYIGVTLRDVDPDLQASLRLATTTGALVQDVKAGSPAARIGLRPYDVIVGFDGRPVEAQDRLSREIAERQPGSTVRIAYLRDGRTQTVSVRLAERPKGTVERVEPSEARSARRTGPGELGLSLIEVDHSNAYKYDFPSGLTGLWVQNVEPLSVAYDGGIERGSLILEINREPVNSIAAFRRIINGAKPGDVLAFYLYEPELEQRAIRIVRTESR